MICFASLDSPPTTTTTPGYHIPQKAYDLAINVPIEIAEDDTDSKIRLAAVKEIRASIDHSIEIDLITLQRQALENEGNNNAVIVREDEDFFENDAHEKAERALQEDPNFEE